MIDVARVSAEFQAQDELLFVERAIPDDRLARLREEAERLEPEAIRMYVPFVRRGGTVGGLRLRAAAPAMLALYRELTPIVAALVGRPLYEKEDDDNHAPVLYAYRGGDFMCPHNDRCGSPRNQSYSVTVGLVDDSQSRLECELSGGRRPSIATSPGSLTIYNGTRVRHAVSRLGPGQRRIVLSASYRTEPRNDTWNRALQEVTEGFIYFGWRRGPRP